MKGLLILCCFFSSTFGGILLINDSPFMLVAEIQGASGIMLNQVSIAPGEQSRWVQELDRTNLSLPGQPAVSLTPYRVMWKCSHGGYYTTCVNVSPGSLIKASQCEGSHYCKPKEEEEEEPSIPSVESE